MQWLMAHGLDVAVHGDRRLPSRRYRGGTAMAAAAPVVGQLVRRRNPDATPASTRPSPINVRPSTTFSVVRAPVWARTSCAGTGTALGTTTLSATLTRPGKRR